MGWFEQNSPQNTGVTGGQLGTPVASTTMGQAPQYAPGPGGGVPLSTQGDPKQIALQYAQSLGPPSPENIQKTADYMKSLGFNVQANPGSDGFFINGVGVDMVSNFHGQGPSNWQWLPDAPIPGVQGGGGFQGQPGGYWTGTTTGGGQYPLASAGGPGLATPWTTPFNAPNDITEQNDPGFQARMKMGTDAIQRSAAAKGTLLTGGLLKGLNRYAQDYASNEYNNVYNRALGQYQMAYDIFNNNGNSLFNRLGTLGSIGENAAAGVGNIQQGVGNANAAASINQGNIWGNIANQAGNLGQLAYMNSALTPRSPNPANYTGYDPSSYTGQSVPGDG